MKKNYLLLVILFMILISCKQNGSTTQTKTDSSKTSNNGIKLPDIGDIKTNNNNNTNSTGSWSKAYRDKFMDGCISKASEHISAAQAFSYCSCMVDKVQAKYPNENDADTKLTDVDIDNMKSGCLPADQQNNSNNNQQNQSNQYNNNSQNNSTYAPWSTSDQQEFMNSCVNNASTSLGKSKATDYCNCMLQKIMVAYPDSKQAANISKTQMNAWAADCIK